MCDIYGTWVTAAWKCPRTSCMCAGLVGGHMHRPELSSRNPCEGNKGERASPAVQEGRRRWLTCGRARGAAVVPAQSPCSADTAHIAAGKPGSAPSAKAPHGCPVEAHPRLHSLRGPLGSQVLAQGDGAAVGAEIKEGSTHSQPPY